MKAINDRFQYILFELILMLVVEKSINTSYAYSFLGINKCLKKFNIDIVDVNASQKYLY